MTTETNKAVVRRYIEEVSNGGKLELIDSLLAPHMHEQVRGFLTSGDNPFANAHEEIQDIIAEDDKVMVRWLFKGTHQGEFSDIPATGKAIELTGYGTYYLEDGQITWDTMCMDWLDAAEQMGASVSV